VWSGDGLARPRREEEVAREQANGALEKLDQGIRETKQMVQLQTMELAQEYFCWSVETLKQQVEESRTALEGLLEQVPWGQEESFQILFQELMDHYTALERSPNEAGDKVANLNTEHLRKQGELNATDAARREARKRGVDITEVEGTGSRARNSSRRREKSRRRGRTRSQRREGARRDERHQRCQAKGKGVGHRPDGGGRYGLRGACHHERRVTERGARISM
jgi:pyruvate/2-oxoglutarate dehydrogenase complex dihydrolipoamide acyltransferase (E2) component